MKVKSVSYLGSFADPRAFRVQAARRSRSWAGRTWQIVSNQHAPRPPDLARTSNTPGKTRTINYYLVNEEFFFVDMPGYGYAQVSKAERASWEKLIAAYVAERQSLCGVVQLLDVRHTPTSADRDLLFMVEEAAKPICLVFNKTDKLNRSGRREISRSISAPSRRRRTWLSSAFSSETGKENASCGRGSSRRCSCEAAAGDGRFRDARRFAEVTNER